jgi:hypothetical protein
MYRYETRVVLGELLQCAIIAAGLYLTMQSVSVCIKDWQQGIGNSYESTRFTVNVMKAGIFAAFTLCWLRYRL